jgi:predicted MFS family arabinose efflux permease
MTPPSLGSPTETKNARLFTPAFILLSLAELAYFTAAGLEIPLAPLFAAEVLGANEVGVGVAVGALSLTALHALAPDLTVMIGLRLLLGVAEAFFFVAGFAALADLAPPGRTGEALSFNSLSLYLGIALGPIIGQVLLALGGFSTAWLGAAALALIAALLATRIPETSQRPTTEAPSVPFIHRAAIRPGLLLLSGIGVMAGFFAFVALYAQDIGVTEWSLVLLEFGLIVVGTRIVFARLPDRVPPYRLGAGALALTGVGVAVVAAVPSVTGLLVGTATIAAGVAFTTPAFFTAVITRVAPHERGAAMGTMSVAIDLAFGGGPLVFGLVAGLAGIPAAFAVGSAIALGGAVGAGLSIRAREVSVA